VSDLHCRIASLHVHPIKSCAGFEVPEGALIETGLEFDREWMVVDAHGDMLTQREHPRMALIETRLRRSDLMLRAPGMLALHLSLDTVEAPTRVRVWDDLVKAYEMARSPRSGSATSCACLACGWCASTPNSSGWRSAAGPATSRRGPRSQTASRCW
jgi:hypothetical protein